MDNDTNIPLEGSVNNIESEIKGTFSESTTKSEKSTNTKQSEEFKAVDSLQIRHEKEAYLREIGAFRDTLFHDFNVPLLPKRSRPIISQEIRIQPNPMIFEGAYDGKMYRQKLTIINCNAKSVFLRILPPSSQAFQIKPILLPHRLSPGLSISRNVSFLYTKPTAIPQSSMDIFINNEKMIYEFLVFTSYSSTEIFPKILDFGEIDVGSVSAMKKLTIKNTGTNQVKYSIDASKDQFELIIQPTTGIILPDQCQEISVEVFGTVQGVFCREFWVKTDPLQRIRVQGRFIEPMLSVEYPFDENNIILLSYPVTFVGTKRYRNVVFRNHSSFSSVFYVLRKIPGVNGDKVPFEDDRQNDENCRQFNVFPLEGKLNSDEQCLLQITYEPHDPLNGRSFHITSVSVEFVKCMPGFESKPVANMQEDSSSSEVLSVTTLDEDNQPEQEILITRAHVTMYLYGEIELPKVTLNPDKIHLQKLVINETYVQQFTILNNSETLPLVIRYKKLPCIEIVPKELLLPPNEFMYSDIKIRPSKMGEETVSVPFDLLYQTAQGLTKVGQVHLSLFYCGKYTERDRFAKRRNKYFLSGITPDISNEVGYLVDDVKFNSKIQKPIKAVVDKSSLVFNKNDGALVAFPNDRARSLRPWREQHPCKTIFAKLPRNVTTFDQSYDLTTYQKLVKEKSRLVYDSFIRQKSKIPRLTDADDWTDYDTTDSKLLLENCEYLGESSSSLICSQKKALFVPLTPYEIRNIIVTPKFMHLGLLGANTKCSCQFSLENKNTFPIHVAVNALFPTIEFVQKEFILSSKTQRNVNFIYHTTGGGKKHNTLFIILNFFCTFNVTVLANIASNTVKCISKIVSIAKSYKATFLELVNPINSDVKFEIETDFSHFEVLPASGVIPANKHMTCAIKYIPKIGFTPMKEITVVSESGSKELLEVVLERTDVKIELSTDKVIFGNIPLNTKVSHEVTIRNRSEDLVSAIFSIENSGLYPEITINPENSLIFQNGFVVLTVTVQFKQILKFNVTLNVKIQEDFNRKITLTGNVVLPEVVFNSNLIKLPKIPSKAILRIPFRMENTTTVENYVTFCLKDYPEFAVLTRGEDKVDTLLLNPNEKRDLILEFHPREPVAYCIYLPYILNGILGPPELNRPTSVKCSEYLLAGHHCERGEMNVTSKLSTLKILCAAGKNSISFSTLTVEFLGHDEYIKTMKIINKTEDELEVMLKIEFIKTFIITVCDQDFSMSRGFMDVTVKAHEALELMIEFSPENFGVYTEEVPVFVTNYSKTTPYNYLKLIGSKIKPVLSIDKTVIYFPPVNLRTQIQQIVTVELVGHQCGGTLMTNHESSYVSILFNDIKHPSTSRTLVSFNISFFAEEECKEECSIGFSCPCDAHVKLLVNGCASSSIVINFVTDPDVLKYSTYPYFPDDTDKSPYATVMFSIISLLERWLFCQGFFYQNYYSIPNDISRYPVETSDGTKKKSVGKKNKPAQLPLVQLLLNLMDTSIMKYIDNGILPSESLLEGTMYNYTTYRNVISFLKGQQIIVPGLRPEHLLRYSEYVTFKTKFIDKNTSVDVEESFTEHSFHLFSKQRWTDLLFHIYKVLVLERITMLGCNQDKNQCEYIIQENGNIQEYYEKNKQRFSSISDPEAKLLLWTEYHYNKQKNILWPQEKFPKYQSVKSFKDFYSSVLFNTLTAAYCPYLKNRLNNVYPCPKSNEHLIHNACGILQLWKSLNFSIDVYPETIVAGNKVKILMIVSYLYEVLPNCYPSMEINIDTPLSDSASYDITVQNCGNDAIQYQAIFFENDFKLFELDTDVINIAPGKNRKIKLKFFARMVLPVSSILLLSGESVQSGQKYAKSQVIIINGIPNVKSCEEIAVQIPTYVQTTKKFSIKTPYEKTYNAKICMCFYQANSKQDFISISTVRSRRLLREFTVQQTNCEFVDKGEGTITMKFIFISEGQRSFYLYFCDPEIGDFCVLFTITSFLRSKTTNNGIINISLPDNFADPCTCKKTMNKKCPKVFRADIPHRNNLFWDSINPVVQMCFPIEAYNFFKKFLYTAFAIRILEYHVENSPSSSFLPENLFQSSAEFLVTRSKIISPLDKQFTIKDVISEGTDPLILHWLGKGKPNEQYLELKNTNSLETRLYKLVFPNSDQDEESSGGVEKNQL